jgi:hypothetical protein
MAQIMQIEKNQRIAHRYGEKIYGQMEIRLLPYVIEIIRISLLKEY